MSAATDIVVLVLVIGIAYELLKSGKLEEVFAQIKNAFPIAPTPTPVPLPTPTPTPEPMPESEPVNSAAAKEPEPEAEPEPTATEEPAADEAAPTKTTPAAATEGGDLGCGYTVRPMDSDPNRWRTDDKDGKEVSGGKVYLPSKAEQEAWSKKHCLESGGGAAADGAEPAAADDKAAEDSGGGDDKAAEDSGGEDEDKDKESNYARSCLDYTPMNWA